jgi:hypothetical protein
MLSSGVPFIQEECSIKIEAGIAYWIVGETAVAAQQLQQFRRAHARIARQLAEHDASVGEVLPFGRRGQAHAASSSASEPA